MQLTNHFTIKCQQATIYSMFGIIEIITLQILERILHRVPDDHCVFVDDKVGIALNNAH